MPCCHGSWHASSSSGTHRGPVVWTSRKIFYFALWCAHRKASGEDHDDSHKPIFCPAGPDGRPVGRPAAAGQDHHAGAEPVHHDRGALSAHEHHFFRAHALAGPAAPAAAAPDAGPAAHGHHRGGAQQYRPVHRSAALHGQQCHPHRYDHSGRDGTGGPDLPARAPAAHRTAGDPAFRGRGAVPRQQGADRRPAAYLLQQGGSAFLHRPAGLGRLFPDRLPRHAPSSAPDDHGLGRTVRDGGHLCLRRADRPAGCAQRGRHDPGLYGLYRLDRRCVRHDLLEYGGQGGGGRAGGHLPQYHAAGGRCPGRDPAGRGLCLP